MGITAIVTKQQLSGVEVREAPPGQGAPPLVLANGVDTDLSRSTFAEGSNLRVFTSLEQIDQSRCAHQQLQLTTDFHKKVAVIGAGAYGSAIAKILADNGIDVEMWTRSDSVAEQINSRHTSPYHADSKLPETIKANTDLPQVLDDRGIIVLATPSATLEEVTSKFIPHPDSVVINLAKGFIFKGGNPFQSLEDYKTGPDPRTKVMLPLTMLRTLRHWNGFSNLAMLAGPGFASNILKGAYFGLAVAAEDFAVAERVRLLLQNKQARVFATKDTASVQVSAAMKNIMAVAAGMAESLQSKGRGNQRYFSEEGRAFLLQRGLTEMVSVAQTFAEVHGLRAKHRTMIGMAGIGDLILTCSSPKSRNFTMGRELGLGTPVEVALDKLKITAEGLGSAWGAKLLAEQLSASLAESSEVLNDSTRRRTLWTPISNAVVSVMQGYNEPSRLFEVLFDELRALEQLEEWEGDPHSETGRCFVIN